ncbi:hypothetical protein ABT127_30610 [Streptomyces sp. NPDC001904]|uniref:hypothetical protein n=1 Tax=Streptomyces sp. NPDC001904 TaxID=3154531 RepID=UPI00332574DA
MGAKRPSGIRPFDETSLFWIPVGVIVMLALSWGIAGLIEGGCERGARRGCTAADGYEWHGWVLFLAVVPTYVVVITGLTTDRWPPALGTVLGGTTGGTYLIAQGQATPNMIVAGVMLAFSLTSPVLTWHRRRHGTHART